MRQGLNIRENKQQGHATSPFNQGRIQDFGRGGGGGGGPGNCKVLKCGVFARTRTPFFP